MPETGFTRVLEALTKQGLVVSTWGESKMCRCPAHDDQKASLSLTEGDDGKALLFCHAGCGVQDISSALGLSVSDLFSGSDGSVVVAAYVYEDEDGEPLYRVMRTDPKGFWQERWEHGKWIPGLHGVRRTLYCLPELLAGVKENKRVWIVEGEKDARILQQLGLVATTTVGGAGARWKDDYSVAFQGASVSVIADNDVPGIKHARVIEAALTGVARTVSVFIPPEDCKDVTDVINEYESVDALVSLPPEPLDILGPLDWESYAVEETAWLYKPYLPRGGRVLAFGPPGSLKSLWAMWIGAHLSCEGYKVAYFSLEMRPSETAKRLKQLEVNRDNFQLFTKFNFRSPEQLLAITKGLRETDLIVVDSWSAAHNDTNNNDAVAALDADVFQPIIDATGATLLILDNVGHSVIDAQGQAHAPHHARGASAKGDKMEVAVSFSRPDNNNNFRTRLVVTKMRLDEPMPGSETIETRQDRIEFYEVYNGTMTGSPVWPSARVEPELESIRVEPETSEGGKVPQQPDVDVIAAAPSLDDVGEGGKVEEMGFGPDEVVAPGSPGETNPTPSLTLTEKLALARLKDVLGKKEVE